MSKKLALHAGIFLNNNEKTTTSMQGEVVVGVDPVLNASASYRAVNHLDVGGYISYSTMGHRISPAKPTYFPSKTYYYGVMASYDILALITSKSNLRLKLCATTNIGLVSAKWTEGDGENWTTLWNKPTPEYGAGMSASFFFTKWLGLSMGYTVGKYYNNDNSRLSYGITLKF